jgi:hypothetical protein
MVSPPPPPHRGCQTMRDHPFAAGECQIQHGTGRVLRLALAHLAAGCWCSAPSQRETVETAGATESQRGEEEGVPPQQGLPLLDLRCQAGQGRELHTVAGKEPDPRAPWLELELADQITGSGAEVAKGTLARSPRAVASSTTPAQAWEPSTAARRTGGRR